MNEPKKLSIDNGYYVYKAQVLCVIDGDTVDLLVDLGFGVSLKQRFRLYAINAPEMKGEDKDNGKASKEYLQSLIGGEEIKIKTFQDSQGKYGRYLAYLYINGNCVNDLMVSSGHAVEFMKCERKPRYL